MGPHDQFEDAAPARHPISVDQLVPMSSEGWREEPQDNRSVETSLSLAARHTGATVLLQNTELKIVWALNVPSLWKNSLLGARDGDYLPAGEAARLTELKRRALEDGQPSFCELQITSPVAHWFNVWIDPLRNEEGMVYAIATTMVDVTEQKQRERALHMLLREVSHRSKNLLAIIQSIASQTGRFSTSIDGFLNRFRGRLQSIAASQDLVTLSNWRGAQLRDLVANQVERYLPTGKSRIDFAGPDLHLNPNAALHIGLALHELGANSLSYGALGQADGRVDIVSEIISEEAGERSLNLLWQEDVPMAEFDGIEKRFGTLTLERVVPASLRGHATLVMSEGELRYELTVPLSTID
jgi:two-component sensor histidine kinase